MRAARSTLVAAAASIGLGACVIGDATEGSPVRFAAGTPVATAFVPGQVVHEVCVVVDADDGYVRPLSIASTPAGDGIGPAEGAAVQALPLDGVECPADPPDGGDGSTTWLGGARLTWQTGSGRAVVVLEHASTPAQPTVSALVGAAMLGDDTLAAPPVPPASAGEIVLQGAAFAGYDVEVGDAEVSASYVRLPIDVRYRAAGALATQPAGGITLSLSFLPEGPTIFGSSTGGADQIVTDAFGHVDVLLLGASVPCEDVAVFITPAGGGTALATTLTCAL